MEMSSTGKVSSLVNAHVCPFLFMFSKRFFIGDTFHPSMAFAAPMFPSSKETTNYARLCRLLVGAGSQVLRETFDKIHPPGVLDKVLTTTPAHPKLKLLRKKKILSPSQWDKLYPVIKSSVTSKNLDITLQVLLLRNICSLTPPATGWDALPLPTDLTREAEIVRIKCYRNTVYAHAPQASIDDTAFDNYWKNIRDALVHLGGATYGAAIDALKYDCMDPEMEDHYKELLKQWKMDEDNIKDKLDNIEAKIDKLDAKIDKQLGSTSGEWNTEPLNSLSVGPTYNEDPRD